jgi:signal transduction histidine kinase
MPHIGLTSNIEPLGPSFNSVDGGRRIGPRAAMICGFCALLVLMVVLAFDSIHALDALETSSARVRQDYLSHERTLRKIRISLYESGNLLREYALADPGLETPESYLAQLHDMRDHANAAMESSLRQALPQLRDLFRNLANELTSYWLAADHTLSEGANRKNNVLSHRAALAQRAAVLAITSEVSDANELELCLAEQEISSVFARSRHRLQNAIGGREVSRRTGLFVEVIDHHFDDDLPEAYKTCIYRVVQEALHNCTAHASASRVRVLLEADSKHFVLSIDDDGVGFDPRRKHGMGLLGMQERVARLGGTFLVDSAPGTGSSIRVELPPAPSGQSKVQP